MALRSIAGNSFNHSRTGSAPNSVAKKTTGRGRAGFDMREECVSEKIQCQ